jgi:predicted transglutaminase-like cysteine proteinase
VGSVFRPNDISNKRRKKISDINDDNNKDIIPEGDHENKQDEDIKEYDDRN